MPLASYQTSVPVVVDDAKCIADKGCTVCVDVCPLDVLRISDMTGKAFMAYDECWYCMPCEADCPTGAVTVNIPYLLQVNHGRSVRILRRSRGRRRAAAVPPIPASAVSRSSRLAIPAIRRRSRISIAWSRIRMPGCASRWRWRSASSTARKRRRRCQAAGRSGAGGGDCRGRQHGGTEGPGMRRCDPAAGRACARLRADGRACVR